MPPSGRKLCPPPRLREIQEQLRRTASRVMAAALRRGQDPLPEIARLREENLGLQAERRQLLSELGLPEDALEDTPACPLCGDTGFRGGELCRCLKTYYVEEQRPGSFPVCWIWAGRALTPLTQTGTMGSGHRERANPPGSTWSGCMTPVWNTPIISGKNRQICCCSGGRGWERRICPPPLPGRSRQGLFRGI